MFHKDPGRKQMARSNEQGLVKGVLTKVWVGGRETTELSDAVS